MATASEDVPINHMFAKGSEAVGEREDGSHWCNVTDWRYSFGYSRLNKSTTAAVVQETIREDRY